MTDLVPNKFNLYVGQRDLNNGIRNLCDCCPVALALKRKFPNSSILVGTTRCLINRKGYKICNIGQHLIFNFDTAFKQVKPSRIIITRINNAKSTVSNK